jgi:hypothetical protein
LKNNTLMNLWEKTILNSKDSHGKHGFEIRNGKHYNKNTQSYGMIKMLSSLELIALEEIDNFDFIFGGVRRYLDLEDQNNSKEFKEASSNYLLQRRCLKILKVTKSLFFMLALIFFALFKQYDERKDVILNFAYGFLLVSLVFEESIEGFLFFGYIRLKKVPCRVSFIKYSYLLGNLCFISIVALLVTFKELTYVSSICIICLFSVASLCIIVSYLMVGWLFCSEKNVDSGNTCCFRTFGYKISSFFMLFISGFGFITLADFKFYKYLIKPTDFIIIPWRYISVTLILSHSIIISYHSFLKAKFTLCELICTEKEDMAYVNGEAMFVGWDRCLYLVLELLVSLKLDEFLLGETNWLIILVPAYLVFIFRVILDIYYDNDIHEISSIAEEKGEVGRVMKKERKKVTRN